MFKRIKRKYHVCLCYFSTCGLAEELDSGKIKKAVPAATSACGSVCIAYICIFFSRYNSKMREGLLNIIDSGSF